MLGLLLLAVGAILTCAFVMTITQKVDEPKPNEPKPDEPKPDKSDRKSKKPVQKIIQIPVKEPPKVSNMMGKKENIINSYTPSVSNTQKNSKCR